MSPEKNKILSRLGVFSTAEAVAAGLSQPTISRAAVSGELIKLAHGFYMHPEASIDSENIDFVIACKKFGPSSFIGGLSSLFRYGLIEEVPDRIWIVVPENIKTIDTFYRCIRSSHDLSVGVVRHKNFRIADVHRSVLEAMHYSTKVGARIAISAARNALREGKTSESHLYKLAVKLGFTSSFSKYWDAIALD
jgi:predicted transcriptional regulator of viral defense system